MRRLPAVVLLAASTAFGGCSIEDSDSSSDRNNGRLERNDNARYESDRYNSDRYNSDRYSDRNGDDRWSADRYDNDRDNNNRYDSGRDDNDDRYSGDRYADSRDRDDHRDHDHNDDRYRDRYGDDRYEKERYGKRYDQIPYNGRQLIRIGSVRASGGGEDQNDLIEIKGNQRFAGLMFRVDRGAVEIDHIRVTFADDSAIEPKTSSHFRAGDETRLINLPGADKNVKRVRLKYKGSGNRASIIDVYGLPND